MGCSLRHHLPKSRQWDPYPEFRFFGLFCSYPLELNFLSLSSQWQISVIGVLIQILVLAQTLYLSVVDRGMLVSTWFGI